MKRLLPASLISFLQQNPNCLRADLFQINIPGTTGPIYATDGELDIVLKTGTPGWSGIGTPFLASTYGRWSRGPITSEAAFDLSANSMTLTCVPQQTTAFPGYNINMLGAAFNGLFDAVQVMVYTAYMPLGQWGNVSAGIETKWFGFIEKINKINRTMVEFECQDPLFLLNEKVPKRLIQAGCPWGFADANCNVAGGASAFTVNFTAAAASTSTTLVPTVAFAQADGYYTEGVVTSIAGNNHGLFQKVKLHTGGNLQVSQAWLFPVAAGDTFSVIAGCDKSSATCTQKFNNLIHFGGEIGVPVPLRAL